MKLEKPPCPGLPGAASRFWILSYPLPPGAFSSSPLSRKLDIVAAHSGNEYRCCLVTLRVMAVLPDRLCLSLGLRRQLGKLILWACFADTRTVPGPRGAAQEVCPRSFTHPRAPASGVS
jgi:hypothetical protein